MKDNGYGESIVQHDLSRCFICGANGSGDPLNRHEVFGGAFRQKSKRLGLWVCLCHERCHQGVTGVHNNAQLAHDLKELAQHKAMEHFGWSKEDFIREFGKNYLEDET